MRFNKVEINDFRNLISTSFIPSPSLNIFFGSNGSGKSSLLEALYYLSTGSSFRTQRISHIVSHHQPCFTLFSEIFSRNRTHRIGIQRCKDLNHTTRIDGIDVSRRSELVQLIPLQVLSPESTSLITEGSDLRRNYIDWALFHVEQSFHYHLTHYSRAVKQRNALLKAGRPSELSHWEAQLCEHGPIINDYRMNYVESLKPAVTTLITSLLPGIEVELGYKRGWSSDIDLDSALLRNRENDLKLKYTSAGPHRGDLLVKSSGVKVSESLSRGQLKLVVIALKLAQLSLLYEDETRIKPIILVDDLAAELDTEHRLLLLESIKSLSSQLFITTPDLSLIDYSRWSEKKVFHVEHGRLKEMI